MSQPETDEQLPDGHILAWHFVGDKLINGDPIPADGELLHYDGPMEMCKSGLHASERIIDALRYARGNTVCRVECFTDIERGPDKFICRDRVILWRVNAELPLRAFARTQALNVIHLWNAPDIVREYLETGDESKQSAARSAAWYAARSSTDAAAAAASTALSSAEYTARSAARSAAWSAAWYAEWSAAESAAWYAAWYAAESAAWYAAWDAARSAAESAANELLTNLVETERTNI